jgi:D-tyrosyl-tRNA(Tyr) deacylase
MTRLTTFALVFVLAVVVAVSGRAPAPLAAMAAPLVERFGDGPRTLGLPVAAGRFGAEMQIALVNDGSVTIWLDTKEIGR